MFGDPVKIERFFWFWENLYICIYRDN
jgi:hypothetical protein